MTKFFIRLQDELGSFIATDRDGARHVPSAGIDEAVRRIAVAKELGRKLMFVGNGGSAGIASHMAIDWTKNAQHRALCFNDGAALTCIANDFGFDRVFALPVERFGDEGDILFAISSSGQSPDILAAVEAAHDKKIKVVTLSGFDAENKLRQHGDLNFYVPSTDYGIVECAHLAIAHSMIYESLR